MSFHRLAIALLVVTAPLSAQNGDPKPRLSASPARPEPGSLVQLTLSGASATSVTGTLSGEPLHFTRTDGGDWHAIGAIPVEAPRTVVAYAALVNASGASDSVSVTLNVPPLPAGKKEPLSVDAEYSEPPSPALKARIDRENALARQVGQNAHNTPELWTVVFERPRDTRITSSFGAGRVFNGAVTTRHLGVDFAGKPGDPVRAANRGVVALVDTFFLAGNVVYIDHGGGVVTGYFHLSKPLVAVGDTVSRGQEIGLVGSTGRVTAPHLHWTARYGAITFNPLDLMQIKRE